MEALKSTVFEVNGRFELHVELYIIERKLQAADVGVGICGEEGMQASLAADYSIAQFLYSYWALSSETAIFDSWSIVFYNMFFSSWPPLAIGIWDRLFSFGIMEQYPGLYVLSQHGQTFNLKLKFSKIITW
uniref:PhoLip_ATPase_C domain-containing protein n=1 Tax=Ascaris lumbricoides TaxID=6252 RepID=A0A0M3IW49_ASCLU